MPSALPAHPNPGLRVRVVLSGIRTYDYTTLGVHRHGTWCSRACKSILDGASGRPPPRPLQLHGGLSPPRLHVNVPRPPTVRAWSLQPQAPWAMAHSAPRLVSCRWPQGCARRAAPASCECSPALAPVNSDSTRCDTRRRETRPSASVGTTPSPAPTRCFHSRPRSPSRPRSRPPPPAPISTPGHSLGGGTTLAVQGVRKPGRL